MKTSIHKRRVLFLILFFLTGFPALAGKPSAFLQIQSTVILTEVMFDPAGSEYYDEFVEIYNLSAADSVDLSGWQIGDGEGFDRIVDAGSGLKLAPGQFGLILDSGYFEHSVSYDSLIPADALVLTIDGASFGTRGWSNSSAKSVILLDSTGAEITRYTYSLGNKPGYSDEKINLTHDNSPQNWQNSNRLLGTPGFYNSVSPRENDLALSLINSPENSPDVGIPWQMTLQIENVGLTSAENFTLQGYFYPESSDSLLVFQQTYQNRLNSGEQLLQVISLTVESPGLKNYRFFLSWGKDENNLDNVIDYSAKVPFHPGDLVINEILYYPQLGSPEWLEIYSHSNYTIDLKNWRLATEQYYDRAEIIARTTRNLKENEFIVLCSDSIFCEQHGEGWLFVPDLPHLKDNGEDLFLFDPFMTQVDSVAYRSTWGKRRGFSLERIWYERSGLDSSNWKLTEILGGTPARFNTRSPLEIDLSLSSVLIDPNPVAYSENTNLFVTIRNSGRTEIGQLNLQVFTDVNLDSVAQSVELLLPVQRIETNLLVEDSLQQRIPLSNLYSGITALAVLISTNGDQKKENNFKSRELKVGYPANSIVFNEVMYYPYSGEPEWIEFYNRSNEIINFREWRLFEKSSEHSYSLTTDNSFIPSNSYVIIAADSNLFDTNGAPVLVPERFPSLNNDEENLQLIDFSDSVIDSLHYLSTWGGDLGISLERINFNLAGQASSNWASSAAPSGSTPGNQNSIFVENLPIDAVLSVSPNPFSPDGDGHEDFTIVQYSLPMTTACVSLKIFDLMGRPVCDLLNSAPSGSHREIIWNGKKNNGENLRIGVYIIYLEALNAQKGVIKQIKKTVVVAGKL